MPLQATSGAASYDAFGGGVPSEPNYIESVFSCFLYTGNGSTQTITNGIDLAGEGGLVWLKNRTGGSGPHNWYTTDIGSASYLDSSQTSGLATYQEALSTYNSDGFSLSSGAAGGNENTFNYASWTFRKQPKFFDVVTWTGDLSGNRTLSHALTSTPACIIIKATNATDDWYVYHTSLGTNKWLYLNTTSAEQSGSIVTAVSSTTFTVSQSNGFNTSGRTYVAYLFAHDAGGFGLTGTDNVISCGSYSGTGSTPNDITLGFEPQWLLVKNTTSSGQEWGMFDNMRGLVTGSGGDAQLFANASSAENISAYFRATATGFACEDASTRYNNSGNTYIYIAIRRGPMKVPTSGTSVFSPIVATSGTGTTNFPVDMQILSDKGSTNAILNQQFVDRLRGVSSTTTAQGNYLLSSSTAAESSTYPNSSKLWSNTGFGIPSNYEGASSLYLSFRRAPSFFDEVCYTGTGSTSQSVTHNLTVTPELYLIKRRDGAGSWWVWSKTFASAVDDYMILNSTAAVASDPNYWHFAPTSTTFAPNGNTRGSGETYVAYLFATCAGVSKVGSVTHVEPTTVVCGFTPRFVLIKSTQDTGTNDWFVFDSARGITSGNDPYLRLNSTGAENTPYGAADLIDPTADGFIMNGFGGGNYIFLAIA